MIGAILIVIGLYSVLWGKHKEETERKIENDIPLPIKGVQIGGTSGPVIADIDQVKNGQVGDTNNMLPSLAITMPTKVPATTNNVNQQ